MSEERDALIERACIKLLGTGNTTEMRNEALLGLQRHIKELQAENKLLQEVFEILSDRLETELHASHVIEINAPKQED